MASTINLNTQTTAVTDTLAPITLPSVIQTEVAPSAPKAVASEVSPTAAGIVADSPNQTLSLQAPSPQASSQTPRASAVVGQRVSGFDDLSLAQRERRIVQLIRNTSIFAGGLHNDYEQNELSELLWSTPPAERQALAIYLASTVMADPTSIFGEYQYVDCILDGLLTGESWRSFSFFMYQYTAGFNGAYFEEVPSWWYASRPYDTYTPYWLYPMPYDSPYYGYSRSVDIYLDGRGRIYIPEWHDGNPRPGGGWGNPVPGGNSGDWGNPRPGSGNPTPGSGNSRPGSGNPTPGSGNSRPGGGNPTPGDDDFPTFPSGGNPAPGGSFDSGSVGGGSNGSGNRRPGS